VNSWLHEELERAVVLLQLQQELIESQQLEIVKLRAERDDARRLRLYLIQIVEEQRALTRRIFGMGAMT
jgi:hypothetical protein